MSSATSGKSDSGDEQRRMARPFHDSGKTDNDGRRLLYPRFPEPARAVFVTPPFSLHFSPRSGPSAPSAVSLLGRLSQAAASLPCCRPRAPRRGKRTSGGGRSGRTDRTRVEAVVLCLSVVVRRLSLASLQGRATLLGGRRSAPGDGPGDAHSSVAPVRTARTEFRPREDAISREKSYTHNQPPESQNRSTRPSLLGVRRRDSARRRLAESGKLSTGRNQESREESRDGTPRRGRPGRR
ncbi:hypothetical protein THAOC_22842 [Thalassiosira oceanica]|uniref:Uncharacterized protein n=1 Tax=Thalassiosira oceanica TaxID=159749 RepID=K0RTH8_THAOC|nr:hypothetical protein THAOC_22842 [Thalassiosira oceanica]|eukprot:EJK57148.1 hypothetical protein THAOC_22842 [Thalassiosira oceanica]